MSREWLCVLDECFPERVLHCMCARVHEDALERFCSALGHFHRKSFPLRCGEFEVDFYVPLKELGEFLDRFSEQRDRLEGSVGRLLVLDGLHTLAEAKAANTPQGGEELPQLCE